MLNSIGTFHHGCIKPGFTMVDYCIGKGTLFARIIMTLILKLGSFLSGIWNNEKCQNLAK